MNKTKREPIIVHIIQFTGKIYIIETSTINIQFNIPGFLFNLFGSNRLIVLTQQLTTIDDQ